MVSNFVISTLLINTLKPKKELNDFQFFVHIITGQSLRLGKFMTDQVANMFGHVRWPSVISTPVSITPFSVLIFPQTWKQQIFCQHIKRKASQILRTIVQLVFFLRSQRFMKDVCMTKCINTLTKFFLNIHAVFAKVITMNIFYWWWLWHGKRP